MKPESIPQQFNHENLNVDKKPSIERKPDLLVQESILESGAERFEQSSELSAIASDVGLTTALPTPVAVSEPVDENTTAFDSTLVAGDEDLIEKEWVDRAKKIVTDTQNDPHAREESVNKLKREYIKKRYGRGIGVAS